jgi:hypothetical protein
MANRESTKGQTTIYKTLHRNLKIEQHKRLSTSNTKILRVRVMVFNVTFNNISAISWRSILLAKETGVLVENHHRPQVTDKLYHRHRRVVGSTTTCVTSAYRH